MDHRTEAGGGAVGRSMKEDGAMQSLFIRRTARHIFLSVFLLLAACRGQEEKIEVHRADVQRAEASARSSITDRASPLSYQARMEGFGEAGPVVKVINVIPPYRLDAFGGQLMGDDRGEFGGELMFRDRQGGFHLLMKRNVHGIFQMPFGVVVFTGLSHLGSNVGGVYLVKASSDSIPMVTPFQALKGAPDEVVRTLSGELVFKVFNGHFERNAAGYEEAAKDCYLMRKSGEIEKLRCSSIVIAD